MMSTKLQLDRRTVLKTLAYATGAATLSLKAAPAATTTFAPRQPGELDIHHIDTGRGNSTLLIAPDGTTLMIDAGAAMGAEETSSTPRPNTSRRPGEWLARYAQRHTAANHLDYLLVTHIHPDHIGDVDAASPQAGPYKLTGVTDVDHILPITTIIDRGFPNYGENPPPAFTYAENYLAFLKARVAAGRDVQKAEVGSDQQVQTRTLADQPPFRVRVLAADGVVWTGKGNESRLPANANQLPIADRPTENDLSTAIRCTYGNFSYFAGGDLNADTHDGRLPWMDVETPTARAAGQTEVAAADHHGYFDACGPAFVQALNAQVYIVQAWDVGHPGSAQMQRMLGAFGGKPTHDVFTTDLLPAIALMNRRFTPMLKSRRGHVVVRVAPGGDTYQIFVLDSSTEDDTLLATFGPYHSRKA